LALLEKGKRFAVFLWDIDFYMPSSSITLTEADIRNPSPLIKAFTCRYGGCHKEMDMLAKRFEVPLEHTYLDTSSAISARAYAFLLCINGAPKLLEVIDCILQKGFGSGKECSPNFQDFSKPQKVCCLLTA